MWSTKRLWHLRDIRFANNAGISMPVCRVAVRGYQDMDATRMRTTTRIDQVTCQRCVARAWRWYPWAYPRPATDVFPGA